MDVEEDQASGEPPAEAMDHRNDMSVEATKSEAGKNKQMIVKKKIEQYFHLITQGCNRTDCKNPNCASNPSNLKISGNEAAVKAIQLLRQKAELCPLTQDTPAMGESSNPSVSSSQSSVQSDNEPKSNQVKLKHDQSLTDIDHNGTGKGSVGSNDKKDLKVHRVEDVRYLTEEMIDQLISKCQEEEAMIQDCYSSDSELKKTTHKDPYNALFVALTEVFSNMENLNRSFLKKAEDDTHLMSSNASTVQSEEAMDVDSNKKDETNNEPNNVVMTDLSVTDPLSNALTSFFSNEFPNTSGLRRSNAIKKHPHTAKNNGASMKIKVSAPTLDVDSVRRVYKKLEGIQRANDAFVSSLYLLSTNLDVHLNILKQLPGALDLNLFVIVMENPMLHSPEYFETALPEFCKVLGKLPEAAMVELVKWWSKYTREELRTFVQCFQQLLTVKVVEARLSQPEDADTLDLHKHFAVANAVKCLKIFYYASLFGGQIEKEASGYLSKSIANKFDFPADDFDIEKKVWRDPLSEALGVTETDVVEPILPLEEFQNEVLNESISVYNDFTNAIDFEMKSDEFTFMKYPFVLNIVNKTTYFFYDNKVQMLSGRRLMILQSILSHSPVSPYLRLKIRRDHVIEDALVRLELVASDSPIDLRKQLYVEFEGEQGVDEGGVSKEFFQLVVEQIFNPDYGMFTFNKDTRLFWFNQDSLESMGQFTLIGIVLGLAIYNSCILDIKFPPVVFKKLLGKKSTFEDLKQSHPSIYQSLDSLLNYEGNVEDDIMAVFSVGFQGMFDVNGNHELKPDGENIPVTNDNRQEFVDLYTSWLLDESIKSQFEAFRHGFDLVVAKSPLKYLFRSDELDVLISGSQEYDFKSLEEATEYDGGFSKGSETVKHFWSVVHEMTEDDQKKLLQFTTGTDRAPVGGLAQLKLVIARNGPRSDRLPTAHTCFNVILLPDYGDREKLKERLHKAITYAKGFGML